MVMQRGIYEKVITLIAMLRGRYNVFIDPKAVARAICDKGQEVQGK